MVERCGPSLTAICATLILRCSMAATMRRSGRVRCDAKGGSSNCKASKSWLVASQNRTHPLTAGKFDRFIVTHLEFRRFSSEIALPRYRSAPRCRKSARKRRLCLTPFGEAAMRAGPSIAAGQPAHDHVGHVPQANASGRLPVRDGLRPRHARAVPALGAAGPAWRGSDGLVLLLLFAIRAGPSCKPRD
jgi:hypothetical protein